MILVQNDLTNNPVWSKFLYTKVHTQLHPATRVQYKYTGKFVAFKGMIFISKFLYKILSTIASVSESAIPSYYVEIDGKKELILKNKTRITSE